MKKDRKKRKEAIRRLEKLEDMNRAGENVSSLDLIGALYPKFVFYAWRGISNKETYTELLEEVKSLVDVADYITCPRSREKKAIHIGDTVYEVGGSGEPLAVEKINISHVGSVVGCKSLSDNWLEYRPQRLTFCEPDFSLTITKDGIEWHNN